MDSSWGAAFGRQKQKTRRRLRPAGSCAHGAQTRAHSPGNPWHRVRLALLVSAPSLRSQRVTVSAVAAIRLPLRVPPLWALLWANNLRQRQVPDVAIQLILSLIQHWLFCPEGVIFFSSSDPIAAQPANANEILWESTEFLTRMSDKLCHFS